MSVNEEGKYYNRLYWVLPDGRINTYDKRHTFTFAGEDKHYAKGFSRIIEEWRGWRICPLICYDLRFPVWSRNTLVGSEPAYDVLLYVANWPDKRKDAWKSLLKARAIENQCYVIGVNRVGEDPKNYYSGDSSLINALGETLYINSHIEEIYSTTISKYDLNKVRLQLPFLNDKDNFKIID